MKTEITGEECRLRELVDIDITDGTHKTPIYSECGYTFLSSKNVAGGKIDWCNVMHIPEELHNELYERIKPQKDDILLAKNGTTGVAAIVDRDEIFDIYVSLALIRPNTKKVLPKYLLYALNCEKSKRFFDSSLKGVGVPNLHLREIRETPITVYSIEQQKIIVEKLDSVENVIQIYNDLLALHERVTSSYFTEMFGDPILNSKGLPVKKLKELSILITNGNTPKGGSENYVDKGVLFIRSQNVWRNRIELDDVVYIDESIHKSMRKSSVKSKDILITKTGRINTENSSLGRAAIYLGEDDSANINGHVYLVRLNKSVVPEYVLSILTSEAYRKYIRKVCVGGIDKRQINLNHVEDFPIILPSLELQQQFADFVEQVEKAKQAIMEQLEQLEILKKSLMQKYFG